MLCVTCAIPGCNGGRCPCGRCHGAGYTYVPDPSGAREDFGWPGTEGPKMIERYCECAKGERMMADGV